MRTPSATEHSCPGKAVPAPVVSVIVPARNEERSIENCLMSLCRQEGTSYEIIVVDDGSSDRTRAIAESIAGRVYSAAVPAAVGVGVLPTPAAIALANLRVIEAGPLPHGWIGKSHACHVGVCAARGEWLLFTDADTFHQPGSLARAVAEARRHDAALLSYSPRQIVTGPAQRALMPLVFSELACSYNPRDVSDPDKPAAAANGQYLLITREAYNAIGGHKAVAADVLEDVALARAVKCTGRRIRFRYGGDAVCTRMYRTWPQMREGWTKNLALLFPNAEQLAVLRSLEFLASVGALGIAALAAISGRKKLSLAASAIGVAASANLLRRVRKAHFDPLSSALSPFGLPLFAYLLARSRISHSEGRVQWKGREYLRNQQQSARPEDDGEESCGGFQ